MPGSAPQGYDLAAVLVNGRIGWFRLVEAKGAVVDLQVAARPGRGCTVVTVHGELDMETTPRLRQCLQPLIDAGDRQVLVDLAGVSFMDSSALGALVTMFTALSEAGGRLSLAAVQPSVRTVLRITSVDRVIDIYDSVDAAEADMPLPDGVTGG